jgi:hypothetical protein
MTVFGKNIRTRIWMIVKIGIIVNVINDSIPVEIDTMTTEVTV